jgi:hypothetical protein
MFRQAQGARDREDDGRLLYLAPPLKNRNGSASPSGREAGARFKRLVVACDGMPTIFNLPSHRLSISYVYSLEWTANTDTVSQEHGLTAMMGYKMVNSPSLAT